MAHGILFFPTLEMVVVQILFLEVGVAHGILFFLILAMVVVQILYLVVGVVLDLLGQLKEVAVVVLEVLDLLDELILDKVVVQILCLVAQEVHGILSHSLLTLKLLNSLVLVELEQLMDLKEDLLVNLALSFYK